MANSNQTTTQTRREFLKIRTIEGLALTPLVGLALMNWDKERTWHELNLSQSRLPQAAATTEQTISNVFSAQQNFAAALGNLSQAYRSAYYETYFVPVVTSNGKNTSIRLEARHRWAEPDNIPSHNSIDYYCNKSTEIYHRLDYLKKSALVDVNELQSIAIEAKRGNQNSQKIITGITYGSIAATTLCYEEIIAACKAKCSDSSYKDELSAVSKPEQIKRRDWLKLGAALMGTLVAGKITANTDAELSAGKSKLRREISEINLKRTESDDQKIKDFLSLTPSEMRQFISEQVNLANAAINVGIRNNDVLQAFGNVAQTGEILISQLNTVIGDFNKVEMEETSALHKQFAHLCHCGTATQKLEAASDTESKRAAWAIILESLGVAVTMAAVIVPGEIISGKKAANER